MADRKVHQPYDSRDPQQPAGFLVTGYDWPQESGAAFLRRLCMAVMACRTVWHLQRDESEAAARLRAILVRLPGRQIGYHAESTAPAVLAGLPKLLAIDDLLQTDDLAEILSLTRSS